MIRGAEPADRPAVEDLLRAAGLPLDGFSEHLGRFVVFEDGGSVLGAAGLEIHGPYALLRSVVVAARARGCGLGARLTERAVADALAGGARAVYLLTTTAESFFRRFGFERSAREDLPSELRASRELQGACPASAIAMRRGPSGVAVVADADEGPRLGTPNT